MELPAAVVKVRGIGQRDGVATDGGNGVAKGLPGLRWQPFEELDDFDRDKEPILPGSGFETLIELLKRGPVSRVLVVDLAGHTGPIFRELLVPQGDEKSSQASPLLDGKGLDLALDFLNAHGRTLGIEEGFARRVLDRGFSSVPTRCHSGQAIPLQGTGLGTKGLGRYHLSLPPASFVLLRRSSMAEEQAASRAVEGSGTAK